MRLKLISCKIITREASYLMATSDNQIDATFLKRGFHNEPEKLRQAVQDEIDLVESGRDIHTNDDMDSDEDFAAILIGYGLCSNGVVGLKSTKYPLVIPKAHDCITFFMGTKQRYKHYFDTHPGTFWYTQSWLDNSTVQGDIYLNKLRKKYEEKGFDEDAIEYLLELDSDWVTKYNNAAFISLPEVVPKSGDSSYRNLVKDMARKYEWTYEELQGDISLLRDFIDGNWREEDFLIVPPGQTVAPSYDDDVIMVCQARNPEPPEPGL